MIDTVTHDEAVARIVESARRAEAGAITRAFVGSLKPRNLPARSAFGSYAVLQEFSEHRHLRSDRFSKSHCEVCGLGPEVRLIDWGESVAGYPFQVQHTNILYAAFDLDSFPHRNVSEPSPESVDCLGRLIDALRNLPAESELKGLHRAIGSTIQSNKLERMILLETFGYAGILCPASKPHYQTHFVESDRANSDYPQAYHKREWAYPVRFWTGQDGVNEALVTTYFGELLRA